MTDYIAVLNELYSDAEWTMTGTSYDGLVWLSDSAKPTKATLDRKWPEVQHMLQHRAVEAARRARYEVETDGLYFEAMRADNPDLTAWRAAVDQIKADLPYPEMAA